MKFFNKLFDHKITFVLFLTYILIGAYVNANFLKYNFLPSPLFGGDLYYQLGSIINVLNGGNPFDSSSMLNTIPGYLPLYSLFVSLITLLFNTNPITGMYISSIIIFILSSFLWYFFVKLVFKEDLFALVGMVFFNPLFLYPILKYTYFTKAIVLPIFLISLFLFYKEINKRNSVFLGISLGLLSLSHTVAFIGGFLIFSLFFLLILYKNKHDLLNFIKNNIANFVLLFFFATPLILLYWYKPIFIYHLHSINKMLLWNVDINFFNLKEQIYFIFTVFSEYFIRFDSLFYIIKTIFLLLGIHYILKQKFAIDEPFILFFFIFSLIIVFSYFVTIPLFNLHFVPNYMAAYFLFVSTILLTLFALHHLEDKKITSLIAVFIFVLLIASSILDYIPHNKEIIKYLQPIPKNMISMKEYILNNTNINDVFLSSKELSFALNGLTGRKVMVNRWAQQNNPYEDFSKRDMDAAIILYGNNTTLRKELIKKYNIKYVFWDYYWIPSEYSESNGRIFPYDPLVAFDNKENEEYLSNNGVKYNKLHWWVDPSLHNTQQFDLLFISPLNYRSPYSPWDSNLNEFLKPVWWYEKDGKNISIIYKVVE